MKLMLNPEYNLYEKDGNVFCDSLMVAETFGKRHDNILSDIRNLDCSEKFNLLNFKEINYKDDRNRKQPKYIMTKDGFTFLVMGYRGKKAASFKEAYIDRFNQMERCIQSRLASKELHPALMEAIKESHDTPKHYHYSIEQDMIYLIVLGMKAKKFREIHGLAKGTTIKPYLTLHQIEVVEALQRIDIGLIEAGLNYYERKDKLSNRYQKMLLKATG